MEVTFYERLLFKITPVAPNHYTQLKIKNKINKPRTKKQGGSGRGEYTEDAPEAPRRLKKSKGPQQACRKRAPEYMEDARGTIHRQSIWKTPGGGRQNAAAIKFVGPKDKSRLETPEQRKKPYTLREELFPRRPKSMHANSIPKVFMAGPSSNKQQ